MADDMYGVESMESLLSNTNLEDESIFMNDSDLSDDHLQSEILTPLASTAAHEIDHPEGDAIRGQVEYYFSDENLPNDNHLRGLCRGTKNKPVALGQILSWRKMRRFKPRNLVIAALKKSEVLEVIDDKLIRRRQPWDGSWKVPGDANDPTPIYREPWIDSDFPSDEEGDRREKRLAGDFSDDEQHDAEYDDLAPPPGYKYDKNGGLVLIRARNSKKPTGLEEYFAEAPMTPEEALEADEIFGEDVGIVNRLEMAIQRYFHNRKLDQESRRYLEAFLRFGGVSTSPKPFARLDRQHIDQLDVIDKKAALATHHILPEKFDDEAWHVDFLHVAKGFLSSYFPNKFTQITDDPESSITKACKVVINFYNYLLYHKVCPEKNVQDSILEAKGLATNIAPIELMAVITVPQVLPGVWSKAVARIWDLNFEEDTLTPEDVHGDMDIDEAKVWFIEGMNSCPSNTLHDFKKVHIIRTPKCWHKRVTVLFKGNACLEIVSINTVRHNHPKFASVGIAMCKPWWNPGNNNLDVPEAHYRKPKYLDYLKDSMELWIDNIGLCKLEPGMKIEGKVMHLEFKGLGDFWVIGGNIKVYCSYHTITLNDLDARLSLRAPHLEKIDVYDPNRPSNPPPFGFVIPEPHPYQV